MDTPWLPRASLHSCEKGSCNLKLVINVSISSIVPPFLLHLKRTLYVSLGPYKSTLKPFHRRKFRSICEGQLEDRTLMYNCGKCIFLNLFESWGSLRERNAPFFRCPSTKMNKNRDEQRWLAALPLCIEWSSACFWWRNVCLMGRVIYCQRRSRGAHTIRQWPRKTCNPDWNKNLLREAREQKK